MNGPSYYSNVPLYFFEDKRVKREAIRLLITMFEEYALNGTSGFTDEDGGKIKHKFQEVKKEDTFLTPTPIFLLWNQDEIELDHVYSFLYLCYLAHVQKNHIVKINKNLIKDATGLSKTRFQEVIQELIYHELQPVKATKKANQVEISDLEPGQIETIESLDKKMEAIESGNVESSGTFYIPTYFLHEHRELGFSYRELGIITTFVSGISRDEPKTFDEAVQFVIDHSKKEDTLDSFQVIAAVRKTERKGIFNLIKDNKGYITVSWNNVAS